ncbi:hypothetical protein NPIL_471251 [Nephila pilipes]|uniref:Uncharacterized protein n=1 Tax=Nephila pilipes TaxID=299642 RepID=A0A8X6NJQ0_NEPPI|nr:hypothetical protein NPIL_471251 [Nephila pilipes]
MSIDVGAYEYVPEPWTVSKEPASDLILSTTAYEALRANVQMYGHESPSDDEDDHVSSEEETEDPSVSTEALVELSSTELVMKM